MMRHTTLGMVLWMMALGIASAQEPPGGFAASRTQTPAAVLDRPVVRAPQTLFGAGAVVLEAPVVRDARETTGAAAADSPVVREALTSGPSLARSMPTMAAGTTALFPAQPQGPTPQTAAASVDMGPDDSDPSDRFWLKSEYLLWWTRGQAFPPLVTSSPLGTPLTTAGLLGQPTTTVLFGGERMDPDTRSGGRITAGLWLNEARTIGVQARYFQLDTEADHFTATPATTPVLILPFFDETGAQRRRITNFPGFSTGAVRLDSTGRFYSGDAQVVACLYRDCICQVDALLGYRQIRLNEDFRFRDLEIDPLGNSIDIVDSFGTRNRFHGADLGISATVRRDRWSLDLAARVALGVNGREVNANGTSLFSMVGQAPVLQQGGFLALPTNSGRRTSDEFAAVPEVSVGLGYQITQRLRGTIGYNFIYWPNVFRPADQIDTRVNLSQLPFVTGPGALVGPARPAPRFKESDFWAHGLNFGLEYRY